ncbi:hypothetical protein [Streptomyces griseosporeus]
MAIKELLSVVGVTALLSVVAAWWEVLMDPNPTTPGDWQFGIDLLIAGGGVVLDSLITEKTPHAAARLMILLAVGFTLFGMVCCGRRWGYDAQGLLSARAAKIMSVSGFFALGVTFYANKYPGVCRSLWHGVFG